MLISDKILAETIAALRNSASALESRVVRIDSVSFNPEHTVVDIGTAFGAVRVVLPCAVTDVKGERNV